MPPDVESRDPGRRPGKGADAPARPDLTLVRGFLDDDGSRRRRSVAEWEKEAAHCELWAATFAHAAFLFRNEARAERGRLSPLDKMPVAEDRPAQTRLFPLPPPTLVVEPAAPPPAEPDAEPARQGVLFALRDLDRECAGLRLQPAPETSSGQGSFLGDKVDAPSHGRALANDAKRLRESTRQALDEVVGLHGPLTRAERRLLRRAVRRPAALAARDDLVRLMIETLLAFRDRKADA